MIRLLTCALAMALILPPALPADEGLSIVEGTILDQAGNPISGVVVRARNIMTEEARTAVTDDRGYYSITRVHQGRYSLFASAEGYNSVWIREVLVFAGERVRQDFRLTSRTRSRTQ